MFSLKSLLFIVAVAGLGAAGLIHRTQFWASTMVALTLAVLLLAVCRTWFAPQGRTFWGPFALTGAIYIAIVSVQPMVELHYNLPTTQLVVYGIEKLQTPIQMAPPYATTGYPGTPSTYAPAVTPGNPPELLSGPPKYMFNRETLFQMATTRSFGEGFAAEARVFLWAAQSLWCLLLAFLAGLGCSWLFRSADATRSRPVGPLMQ